MFLTVIVLKQSIKINYLFSRFIITNIILNFFLFLGINLKSIIIYCHRCFNTKKDYNNPRIQSLRILVCRQA